ncbi:hypothetical protein EsVE80_12020 [Enterococcus saigonensis]|uniref:Uncharacterized protein n=1 Tax=Enterococcus saigonensis TaxID=1805431 RepID=A0A679IC29_9ENTE|nr:hypothetical protein [Enterococcus saigonensis]BCA85679.1 hypothetical protein EsVE80_12020 [Enterococcus saigonensis]
MKKRLKKKNAYKKYIHDIFNGYEEMISTPDLEKLTFSYLNEETIIYRDDEKKIRFLTRDK